MIESLGGKDKRGAKKRKRRRKKRIGESQVGAGGGQEEVGEGRRCGEEEKR